VRIRVIGVGSPHGDDAVGLHVLGALGLAPPGGDVELVPCPRPDLDLVEALGGAEAVVLVDAVRSGGPIGAVSEPAPDALAGARPVSSHGFGVAEALALARALGRAPARLAVVGVEAGTLEGDALSDAARGGALEAAGRVRALVAAWQEEAERA
jgi:hydrogenase maturation protease